jgi:hypothetical protein
MGELIHSSHLHVADKQHTTRKQKIYEKFRIKKEHSYPTSASSREIQNKTNSAVNNNKKPEGHIQLRNQNRCPFTPAKLQTKVGLAKHHITPSFSRSSRPVAGEAM